MEHEKVISMLAALINEAVPLAKTVVSDEYSDAEREQVRRLCPENNVFKLSNYVTGLCTEKARQMVLEGLEREREIARLKAKSAKMA